MSKSKTPNTPSPPKANPSAGNSEVYVNGRLQSERFYDPGKKTHVSRFIPTQEQQRHSAHANQGLDRILDQMAGFAAPGGLLSGEGMQQYAQAFAAPQRQALNNAYDSAMGTLTNTGTAQGMRDSVGFENYRQNQIEKNRAQGMADIENQAKLFELQAPNLVMAPYQNAYNMFSSVLGNDQINTANGLQNLLGNASLATNQAQNLYNNQFNAWNAQRMTQQPQQRGFFGKMFGV